MSGLRLAAVGSLAAAVGILLWLYGADMAYVVGLVPTANPYGSSFATATPDRGSENETSTVGSQQPGAPGESAAESPTKGVVASRPPKSVIPSRPPKGKQLVIPRIGTSVPVAGGSSTTALARGAYQEPGTADPGQGGNVALAGHRNSHVFSLLYRLRPGDPVILYWMGKEYDYRVSEVLDVGADDTRILAQTGDERLTLYTCRPREFGDKRTVVIALPAAQ